MSTNLSLALSGSAAIHAAMAVNENSKTARNIEATSKASREREPVDRTVREKREQRILAAINL